MEAMARSANLRTVLSQSWVNRTLIARTPRLESTRSDVILQKLVIYDLFEIFVSKSAV